MINRKQFGRRFAETYGYTYYFSDKLVREMFEFLGTLLFKDGENVTIPGFGAFKHKTAKQKRVRHPLTKEMIVQPERDVVKFTPSEMVINKQE